MLALIMPHPEGYRLSKGLEFYSDNFIALKSQKEAAEELLEECNRYKFVGKTVPFENLSEGYIEHSGLTEEKGKWTLRISGLPRRHFSYVNGNRREMNRLEERLAERQSLKIPKAEYQDEFTHAKGIHFLAGNIDLVDELLCNNQRSEARRDILWVVESKIPGPEKGDLRIDLGLISSDNRIRLIEHGNGTYKPETAINQAGGIRRLYRELNGVDIPPSRVLSHVAQYHIDGDENEVTIYPPQQLQNKFDHLHQLEGIYDWTYAYTFRYKS